MNQSTRTLDQAGGINPQPFNVTLFKINFFTELLMKSLGYSPYIQKMCSTFDTSLQVLLEDVMYYVNDGNADAFASLIEIDKLRNEGKSEKFVDRNELQLHLQNCTLQCMNKYMRHFNMSVHS